jgi:hypothetical protein
MNFKYFFTGVVVVFLILLIVSQGKKIPDPWEADPSDHEAMPRQALALGFTMLILIGAVVLLWWACSGGSSSWYCH